MKVKDLYEELEDENQHGLAALLSAIVLRDTPAVIQLAEFVRLGWEQKGMEHSQIEARYAISQPLYQKMLDEIRGPAVVRVGHDEFSAEMDPSGSDGWKIYSFSRRHNNYKDPESLGLGESLNKAGLPDVKDEDLRAKLDAGLAFFLSYYEHGGCVWSLHGEGPQCRFDSVRCAGLLVWEDPEENIGAKTYEDRQKDARAFLETYTKWANGEIYSYVIDPSEGGVSVGGFFDLDEMFKEIKSEVEGREVIFKGDLADLARDYFKRNA